jgi:radical SAM protein with 4Fe4S-binding SPASM domain
MGNPVRITLAFRSPLAMKETLELPDYQRLKGFPHEARFQTDYDAWAGNIRQQDLLGGMPLRPLSKFDKEPYVSLYDGPIIFADSRIGFDRCRDFNAASELVVGHIMEESLISIWQSERVRKLREKFRERNLPDICSKCTIYENLVFYRCRRGSERRELINLVYPDSTHQSKQHPV